MSMRRRGVRPESKVKNSHAVGFGHSANVVCGSDSTRDRGHLSIVRKALASEVGGTALGDLEDDG